MDTLPARLDILRERLDAAREHASSRRRAAEEAEREAGVWAELIDFVERGWPLHVLSLLDGERGLFDGARAGGGPAAEALDGLRASAEAAAASVRRDFPGLLERAAPEAGLEIHPDSRHPRYFFGGKFFTVDIADRGLTARVSDYEGRLSDLPADVGAVLAAVRREVDRVFGRPFDGPKFLKKLRRQYLSIVRDEGQEDGGSVPIRQITRRLGRNEKGFRSDEFLIDLSRLAEEGPLEIDGRRLDLQHTKDAEQGMLLNGPAGRGYIGFVLFRRTEG